MDPTYKIVFTQEVGSILLEIMERYNLLETDDDFMTKLENHTPLRGEVIRLGVENIAAGLKSNDDLVSVIEKETKCAHDVAQQAAKDVIEKILPFAKKKENVTLPAIKPQIPNENSLKIPAKSPESKPTKVKSGPDSYREEIK